MKENKKVGYIRKGKRKKKEVKGSEKRGKSELRERERERLDENGEEIERKK